MTIAIRPRFKVYREISTQIYDIFACYTDIFESFALDEANLDVTENKLDYPMLLPLPDIFERKYSLITFKHAR